MLFLFFFYHFHNPPVRYFSSCRIQGLSFCKTIHDTHHIPPVRYFSSCRIQGLSFVFDVVK